VRRGWRQARTRARAASACSESADLGFASVCVFGAASAGRAAPERNYDEFENATGNGGKVQGSVLRLVYTAIATALVVPYTEMTGLNWTPSGMTAGNNHGN